MNVNAQIIDQRVRSIAEEISGRASSELGIASEEKLRSLAFVYLTASNVLPLDSDGTFETLTEGAGDFGVDAMHVSGEQDGEFVVTLIQGKYRVKNLEGDAAFPATGIEKMLGAIRSLFDPKAEITTNRRLRAKVEEARSIIRDGYIPRVRAIACNNGQRWTKEAQDEIDRSGFGDQVQWDHWNHDRLLSAMQATRPVDDSLRLTGKALVEDLDFKRILVGRISIQEVASLMRRHREKILERNVRRYLGLQTSLVNREILSTLQSDDRNNFYLYNNGITLVCDDFNYNALQQSDYTVKVRNLQIINGGQTCMTILRSLEEPALLPPVHHEDAHVLLRLYAVSGEQEDLIRRITLATNSQNPVDLRDLRSNDEVQKRLEIDLKDLGYEYQRKRGSASRGKSTVISTDQAAEAILSVLRSKPHQAKFFAREHFGKLYLEIFSENLTGAQLLVSILIYRFAAERSRRHPGDADDFVPYATCFTAMQIGKSLSRDLGIELSELSHLHLEKAQQLLDASGNSYYDDAVTDIRKALEELYGERRPSLQQLSATFRRGDLIEYLASSAPID